MSDGPQAVSLARRMAGKKGTVVQLQAEINTEDDWDKLLTKDGVIVVDVYSDWCGPCVGMVGNLKKCKLEIGGDMLQLAIAKSDDIEVLKRFRNKSEPTWMFISGGQLLNVIFGANAPRLMQLIEQELKNEEKVKKGELTRKTYSFSELTPEEEQRAIALALRQAEEERQAKARQLAARNEERDRHYSQMVEQLTQETVVVCLPHAVQPDDSEIVQQVETALSQIGVSIVENCQVQISPEIWEEITYREDVSAMENDVADCLQLGPCVALLLKCQQTPPPEMNIPEQAGDVERLVAECLAMGKADNGKIAKLHPNSIPAQFMWIRKICDKKENETESENSTKSSKRNSANNKDRRESDSTENGKDEVNGTKKLSESSKRSKSDKSEGDGTDLVGIEEDDGIICSRIETEVPGLITPLSHFSKCACVKHLFPARAQTIAISEVAELPPRLTLIFETSKADECYTLAMSDQLKDDVLYIGFFDKGDPQTAKLIAWNRDEYAKAARNLENRLVVVVAIKPSEPALEFAVLGPQYVSPNETTGAADADMFFPPGVHVDLPNDTDIEEDGEDLRAGGVTPTTAVTIK